MVASQNGGPNEFIWHNVNGLKVLATVESVGWGLGTLFANFEWGAGWGPMAGAQRNARSTGTVSLKQPNSVIAHDKARRS